MFLSKIFKLPSPIDLGHSKNDSLPMRMFTDDVNVYTWEDWREEVKKLHPIKYFFAETLESWISRKIIRPFKDKYYWLVSHLIPSRRYHILDLRQSASNLEPDYYRYGWTDVDQRMLYAMFNLLNDYVDNELSFLHFPSKQEVEENESLKYQREVILEIKTIYSWWNIERKIKARELAAKLDAWYIAKQNRKPNANQLHELHRKLEVEFDQKEEEMTIRLMKIRKNLWS
jgi:hypothetical protein